MYILNFARGFCMALADSVPGVSGGTIAFVLGFYDKFISSLNDLIYKPFEEKKEPFLFLVKLGMGWIIGAILSILFISTMFETHIYSISSLFLGFIIASIPLIYKEEKNVIKNHYKNTIFLILGAVVVFLITYYNPITGGAGTTENFISQLDFKLGLYIFIAGAIAISAMVLPGISGSTLLVIFGLYTIIFSSIKGLLKLDFQYFPIVFIFGLGIVSGILGTIKGVKHLLENYRSATIYCILGLMIGAIYAVIMGPQTIDISYTPVSFSNFSFVFFIIGFFIIFALDRLKFSLNKKINS